MNMLTALAIAVGVLLAVWVKVAPMGGMPWFIGAIGWACVSAAGGKMNGLKKAVAAGVAGMLWVAIAELIIVFTHQESLEWIVLGLATFVVVIQARLSWLSFIPAGLCGVAVVGAGGPIGVLDLTTNIKLGFAFVIGAVLGYVAEWAGGMLTKKA
jgi:hypothetical protein